MYPKTCRTYKLPAAGDLVLIIAIIYMIMSFLYIGTFADMPTEDERITFAIAAADPDVDIYYSDFPDGFPPDSWFWGMLIIGILCILVSAFGMIGGIYILCRKNYAFAFGSTLLFFSLSLGTLIYHLAYGYMGNNVGNNVNDMLVPIWFLFCMLSAVPLVIVYIRENEFKLPKCIHCKGRAMGYSPSKFAWWCSKCGDELKDE